MKSSEFFGKFKSSYLWLNIFAMGIVIVLAIVGIRYGLNIYTHHGESIAVPNVKHKSFQEAERILTNFGFRVVVSDTGYVKSLPPNYVLEQSIQPGEKIKSDRTIYLTINASKSPTISLPDIIDNSSLREAMAKLSAMGFKLGLPQYIPGEKEWVYGILVNGKHVSMGDKISIEDTLIIQAGNGMRDESDSVSYVDPVYPENNSSSNGDVDGFEEVTGPVDEHSSPVSPSQPSKTDGPQKTAPSNPQK